MVRQQFVQALPAGLRDARIQCHDLQALAHRRLAGLYHVFAGYLHDAQSTASRRCQPGVVAEGGYVDALSLRGLEYGGARVGLHVATVDEQRHWHDFLSHLVGGGGADHGSAPLSRAAWHCRAPCMASSLHRSAPT